MSMEQFINDNLAELQASIKNVLGHYPDVDDIENWILNDEGLYNWARSEGVDI